MIRWLLAAVPIVLTATALGGLATPKTQPAQLTEQGLFSIDYLARKANFQTAGHADPTVTPLSLIIFHALAPVGPNLIDGNRPWVGTTLTMPTSGSSLSSIPRPDSLTPLRYRSSDGDFAANVWLGKSLFHDRLSVGIGHRFLFAAAATAEAEVSDNPTGRMELSTGPNGAWFLGATSLIDQHEFGAVYSQSLYSRLIQKVNASVQVTPGVLATVPMVLTATTRWEPEAATVSYRYRLAHQHALGASITWENWRPYEPPFMIIESPGINQNSLRPEMQNTLSPGLSWNSRSLNHRLNFDYTYRPSPLSDATLSGPLNLLDSNTHSFLLRYVYELGTRSAISLFTQYDRFIDRPAFKTTRTIGDYTISGNAWSWGASVQLAL